jgi:putative transposase
VHYRSRPANDDAIRARLRALASIRRRCGYRRLHFFLGQEGLALNLRKLRRIYREERLQVRRRIGRKRALGTRAPMAMPQGPNQRWSLDFASDALTDGRRFRILVVVDDFTRECLTLVADTSLGGVSLANSTPLLLSVGDAALTEPPECGRAIPRLRRRLWRAEDASCPRHGWTGRRRRDRPYGGTPQCRPPIAPPSGRYETT